MDYSSEVQRRFTELPAAGTLQAGLAGRFSGEGEDRSLNVWVRFELKIVDGRVADARFQAYGCPHTIAAASWAAEWIRGRGVEALSGLDVPALLEQLEVPTEKAGKVLRVEDALLECRRRFDEMEASALGADHAKGS
jgi:NifU-like protein involved in Fe-S cluster formation